MEIFIREGTINDVSGIAKVHVDSWNTTYKNIVRYANVASAHGSIYPISIDFTAAIPKLRQLAGLLH